MHFTPTSASWINPIGCWFAELTRKQLKRGVHTTVRELEADTMSFVKIHNENPRPYPWIQSADEILASVKRICRTGWAGKRCLVDRLIFSGIIMSSPLVMCQIVVEFLGWLKRSDDFIDEVVNYGQFDNIRKPEEANALNNVRLRPPQNGDPEGLKCARLK